MICPACGARNTTGAPWCTQCYERLDVPAPSVASTSPTVDPSPGVAHPDVRTTEQGVEWCCAACGSWTSIDRFTCSVCGLRMGSGPVTSGRSAVDPDEVTRRAAVVPGGGHLALGRRGTGATVLATVVLWVVGGALLFLAALDGGQPPLSGLVLLGGAAGLWVASFRDARVLARGGTKVLLQARTLRWVVAGVTGLLAVTLLVASLQAAA